jgi:hypothetical protein
MTMIKTLEIPATSVGALAPAMAPDRGIFVLAQAVDARLYAAPLGTTETNPFSPVWVDCGTVSDDNNEAGSFALAVQQAWAAEWAGP